MGIEPLIKWAGGKRRLLPVLLPLILERKSYGGTYFEPFLGGGAVALSMERDQLVVAADACADLVQAWESVQSRTIALGERLAAMAAAHSPDHYYLVRSQEPSDPVERAARFIYLNKTGFNGLYRRNRAGKFNVPIGRGRATSIPTYGELLRVGERMRHSWTLHCADFECVVEAAREGDVVYADSPYDGTHDYSSGFGESDQARLAACLRRAARRGVGVVATNSDTPLVRRLYSWASVTSLTERWCLSATPEGRGGAACVVAVRP